MSISEEKRVLVIDDDQIVGQFIGVMLGKEDPCYSVRHARTGEEGLREARAWRPHLVITDILHPGLGGFGIIRELTLDPNTLSTRFIILSGVWPPQYSEEIAGAFAAGVSVYLKKPFSAEELLKAVVKIFDGLAEERRKGL